MKSFLIFMAICFIAYFFEKSIEITGASPDTVLIGQAVVLAAGLIAIGLTKDGD